MRLAETIAGWFGRVEVVLAGVEGYLRDGEEALARGVHVVTANKLPLVASSDRIANVKAAAAKSGAQLRYEATVGAGLPIVRTSPDHGTGFDIAGRGIARADSFIAAVKLASDMAAKRATR